VVAILRRGGTHRSGTTEAVTDAPATGQPAPVDLLVTDAFLITMDAQRRVFEHGAVAIRGREIVAVGRAADVEATVAAARVIRAGGGAVHPGFVECHNHTTLHTARGAFGDTISWNDVVPEFYVPYWNTVTDDEEYAGAALACLEMLRNGTTCFVEAGTAFEPEVVARAASETGIRALVGDPFLWDNGGFTLDSPTVARAPYSTERALGLLGGQLWRNEDPDALVRGHIAVVGMASASDELEMAAKATADGAGVVLNQHQSYCEVDAADDDTRLGIHPLRHLAEIGVLGPNCVFAHMNIIREDEVEPVLRSGMAISWNAPASMMWGIGGATTGRHAELYRAGVPVGLGSDSSNWANSFDIGRAATLAILAARDGRRNREILTAEDGLTMATVNGARAVGLADRIGSLEPGKRADLVIRSNRIPEAHPTLDPIGAILYATGSKSVDTVIVDGRVVLAGGEPTQVNAETVYRRVDAAGQAVLGRMGYRTPRRWPHIA
jgi:5-methylthioadenosine/S-adenosylhomocysteine deaminase